LRTVGPLRSEAAYWYGPVWELGGAPRQVPGDIRTYPSVIRIDEKVIVTHT
jgi:hypothetical protein